MTAAAFTGFGADALDFYEGLAADSSRTYGQANRATYLAAVADPLQALAEALAPEFGEAKALRSYRDLCFTLDKRPYQEHAAVAVGAGEPDEPGSGVLHLQLSLDGLLVAGGCYRPARDQLARFRRRQDDGRAGAGLDRRLDALAARGYPIGEGDPVTTAPRGRPREHPRIALLRRRNLTVGATHAPGVVAAHRGVSGHRRRGLACCPGVEQLTPRPHRAQPRAVPPHLTGTPDQYTDSVPDHGRRDSRAGGGHHW